jgi:hypothetical protein
LPLALQQLLDVRQGLADPEGHDEQLRVDEGDTDLDEIEQDLPSS